MLCDTIRIFRLERGLSTQELGEAIGVSQAAIENYEANKWQPGLPTLTKLAGYFGVSVADLQLGFSLLYDDNRREFIVARSMGGNQIKEIGRVQNERL